MLFFRTLPVTANLREEISCEKIFRNCGLFSNMLWKLRSLETKRRNNKITQDSGYFYNVYIRHYQKTSVLMYMWSKPHLTTTSWWIAERIQLNHVYDAYDKHIALKLYREDAFLTQLTGYSRVLHLYTRCFFYRGATFWNSLSAESKKASSLYSFKKAN